MDVIEPSTPPERLQKHLEGHRRIYEHFYSLGPKAADRATRMLGSGWRIKPDSKNLDSAKVWFLQTAKDNAKMEYNRYTQFPAENATKYYDNLTWGETRNSDEH